MMESTRNVEDLLDNIRPPRLEDAGLEDCALPPDLINEAFLKAATAVRSRAASIFGESEGTGEEEGDCVVNPWPKGAESSDVLVGISEGVEPPAGACSNEKAGGVPEVFGDEVAAGVTEAEGRVDEVVLAPDVPDGGKPCVDGLQGLKIGGNRERKSNKSGNGDEYEKEKGDEKPALVETLV